MAEVPVSADEALPAAPSGAAQSNGAIELAGPTAKSGINPDEFLVGAGWIGTGLALALNETPFQFLLKETLKLSADHLSAFLLVASIPIYIKPFAGILSDAVPLCGTRRRHYLLLGLAGSALSYFLLGVVPRQFTPLLVAYFCMSIFTTLTSTVLGGVMVEIGKRDQSTGRLSAQRLGIVRLTEVIGFGAVGFLQKHAYAFTTYLCVAFTSLLIPFFYSRLKEAPTAKRDDKALAEVGRQLKVVIRSKTLWSAAALVILVIISPGFNTPLLYFQRDVLKFEAWQVGALKVLSALGGLCGAFIYGRVCRGFNLRQLLAASIVCHAVAVPFYLFYRSWESAIAVTIIEGMTLVIALLPLYDLAARATPRGSEALGYCVMMSVWNFTHKFSDYIGSLMYSSWGLTFSNLVWVNTATTASVLIAVPFLPAVLMDHREGEAVEESLEAPH